MICLNLFLRLLIFLLFRSRKNLFWVLLCLNVFILLSTVLLCIRFVRSMPRSLLTFFFLCILIQEDRLSIPLSLFVPLSLCNTLDILPFMIGVMIFLVIYCFNGFLVLIIHLVLLLTMISSFALLVMTLIFLIYILPIIIRRLLRISLKIMKN